MTSMSRLVAPVRRWQRRKMLGSGACRRMAQPLLLVISMSCAATSGCILPPPLELDDPDAGLSSPPLITDNVTPVEFLFPGPLTLTPGDTRAFGFTLLDNDIDDVLFVRMFVDYSLE